MILVLLFAMIDLNLSSIDIFANFVDLCAIFN